jgi:hypothetical protein
LAPSGPAKRWVGPRPRRVNICLNAASRRIASESVHAYRPAGRGEKDRSQKGSETQTGRRKAPQGEHLLLLASCLFFSVCSGVEFMFVSLFHVFLVLVPMKKIAAPCRLQVCGHTPSHPVGGCGAGWRVQSVNWCMEQPCRVVTPCVQNMSTRFWHAHRCNFGRGVAPFASGQARATESNAIPGGPPSQELRPEGIPFEGHGPQEGRSGSCRRAIMCALASQNAEHFQHLFGSCFFRQITPGRGCRN